MTTQPTQPVSAMKTSKQLLGSRYGVGVQCWDKPGGNCRAYAATVCSSSIDPPYSVRCPTFRPLNALRPAPTASCLLRRCIVALSSDFMTQRAPLKETPHPHPRPRPTCTLACRPARRATIWVAPCPPTSCPLEQTRSAPCSPRCASTPHHLIGPGSVSPPNSPVSAPSRAPRSRGMSCAHAGMHQPHSQPSRQPICYAGSL